MQQLAMPSTSSSHSSSAGCRVLGHAARSVKRIASVGVGSWLALSLLVASVLAASVLLCSAGASVGAAVAAGGVMRDATLYQNAGHCRDVGLALQDVVHYMSGKMSHGRPVPGMLCTDGVSANHTLWVDNGSDSSTSALDMEVQSCAVFSGCCFANMLGCLTLFEDAVLILQGVQHGVWRVWSEFHLGLLTRHCLAQVIFIVSGCVFSLIQYRRLLLVDKVERQQCPIRRRPTCLQRLMWCWVRHRYAQMMLVAVGAAWLLLLGLSMYNICKLLLLVPLLLQDTWLQWCCLPAVVLCAVFFFVRCVIAPSLPMWAMLVAMPCLFQMVLWLPSFTANYSLFVGQHVVLLTNIFLIWGGCIVLLVWCGMLHHAAGAVTDRISGCKFHCRGLLFGLLLIACPVMATATNSGLWSGDSPVAMLSSSSMSAGTVVDDVAAAIVGGVVGYSAGLCGVAAQRAYGQLVAMHRRSHDHLPVSASEQRGFRAAWGAMSAITSTPFDKMLHLAQHPVLELSAAALQDPFFSTTAALAGNRTSQWDKFVTVALCILEARLPELAAEFGEVSVLKAGCAC